MHASLSLFLIHLVLTYLDFLFNINIHSLSLFSLNLSGNHYYHIMISSRNWLVNLSIKRTWKVMYTYWGFVCYNFLCFFISATRMHPSSYFRNGCHLPSKVWNGKDCCICSFNTSANWSYPWSSCSSCSLSYKRTSLSGMPLWNWPT